MHATKPLTLLSLTLLAAVAGCDRPQEVSCVPEPAATVAVVAAQPAAPAEASATPPPRSPVGAVAAVEVAKAPAAARPRLSSATSLRVKRLVLAEGVESREPIEPKTAFRDTETDRVYAFVEVENPERLPGEIVVSFEPPDGPEIGNVRLSVGASPRWRTWAFSRAVRELGEWTAVVRDGEGRVLAREPFSVTL